MELNRVTTSSAVARATWLALGLFLLANLGLAFLKLLNKPINPDELQHLHIAWSIAHGKILYRDFWEHHGPLYSLLNGALIFVTDADPTIRILFWSRLLSFVTMIAVGVMTWFMACRLLSSRYGAWLAVAAYASLYMIQNKGVEMRPDVPQTVFWIAGLLLLIRNQSRGSLTQAAVAGAMFAGTILSNAKAGIGPFFVVVFYLVAHWLAGMQWRDIGRDLVGMTLGGCLALAPVLVYFQLNDAAVDFLYFNYVWNVLFNINWSADFQVAFTDSNTSLSSEYFWFFVHDQLPFLLLSILGGVFWIRKLTMESDQSSKQRDWLFTVAMAGTTLGWITDQHSQYFLIFLPLLAILVGYALIMLKELFPGSNKSLGTIVAGATAVAAGAGMLWHGIASTPFKETPLLASQKAFTRNFVAMTERDEPVAVLWSQCGGYMFNENVGFYWIAMPFHSDIIEIISGEHPFREKFIEEMEARQVRYVIGMESWMTEGLSPEAFEYVRNNFVYSHCLWTRKTT